MRRIHPAQTFEFIENDIREAAEFADQNRAANGYPDAIRKIVAPKATFRDLKLTSEVVEQAFSGLLPRIDSFTIGELENAPFSQKGYHNPFYRHEDRPLAFGFGNELYVKCETDDGVVFAIWYDVVGANSDQLTKFAGALINLNRAVPICIADYWSYAAGLVSDPIFFDDYVAFLDEQNDGGSEVT